MSEHNFEVGDRVQLREEDEDILVGEVKSLGTTQGDGETIPTVTVLWDSETETEEYDEDLLELEGEEDELETEFKQVVDDHMQEIKAQLKIASDAISKAEELSEKYGLPFRAYVSPLSQNYFPTTFSDKFGELDSDFVSEIVGAWSEYPSEGGWEHSAVC
jgi:hypothetical protein